MPTGEMAQLSSKPTPATVGAAIKALRGEPREGSVLAIFCALPGWEPQTLEANDPPEVLVGSDSWSCPVPLMAAERAKYVDLFFAVTRGGKYA